MFTFSALALVALVAPEPWLGLAVTLLLVIGYALDAADGQLARLLGGGSSSGEWLDHMVDVTKTCVLHAVGAGVVLQVRTASPPPRSSSFPWDI